MGKQIHNQDICCGTVIDTMFCVAAIRNSANIFPRFSSFGKSVWPKAFTKPINVNVRHKEQRKL